MLSDHPDLPTAIRDKVSRVTRDRDGQITAAAATSEKLKDMHMLYVHDCTRRDMSACGLFPPVQFESKFAIGDDMLPGWHVRVRRHTHPGDLPCVRHGLHGIHVGP
jgi:12-hydroxyjasmonoyl-L-amino acid 12-hydroxylase / fatty acid hydroxylase|uniref:Uncharacterized protein n=1 Tax=Zea mays TaxID=4577 RepID=A0A804NFQ0_MAIZE